MMLNISWLSIVCQISLICTYLIAVSPTDHCEQQDNNDDKDHLACEKMTEKKEKEIEEWSVVLYEESTVFPIHKQERTFTYVNHNFVIKQDWSKLGVAAVVWDAAEVLCGYIELNPSTTQGKTVIELGAGTGIVGMVAALLGGNVTITDRESVLEFLRETVDENLPHKSLQQTKVEALDWRDWASLGDTFDVILGADIVYIEEVFEDLLQTLSKLSRKDTLILLSCRIRYDRDTSFLKRLKSLFYVDHILYDKAKDVYIYKAIKR